MLQRRTAEHRSTCEKGAPEGTELAGQRTPAPQQGSHKLAHTCTHSAKRPLPVCVVDIPAGARQQPVSSAWGCSAEACKRTHLFTPYVTTSPLSRFRIVSATQPAQSVRRARHQQDIRKTSDVGGGGCLSLRSISWLLSPVLCLAQSTLTTRPSSDAGITISSWHCCAHADSSRLAKRALKAWTSLHEHAHLRLGRWL